MATIVTTLPQRSIPIRTVSITDVVHILPKTLPWKLTVWVGDRLARFGKTTESITFLAEMDSEPTVDQRLFFQEILAPLGLPATLIEDWKNQRYQAVRLYNEGKLIINKETMCYTELPTPVYEPAIITVEEALKKLPVKIPWTCDIYLTGGLVKNGWTANDFDFIAPDIDKQEIPKMKKAFEAVLKWKVDVGVGVMPEREPVYQYLIYRKGQRCGN